MKLGPIVEIAIAECRHHSHKLRGELRCCRCGGLYAIGRGWIRGERFGPLAATKCKERNTCLD